MSDEERWTICSLERNSLLGIFTLTLAHQFKGYGLLEKLFLFEYLNLTISLRINQTKNVKLFRVTNCDDRPSATTWCPLLSILGLLRLNSNGMRWYEICIIPGKYSRIVVVKVTAIRKSAKIAMEQHWIWIFYVPSACAWLYLLNRLNWHKVLQLIFLSAILS